ncbi:UNVERIFIED_CONTAM: helix-turn-helix domain-containing protein [Halobacillus marinus]|uniref:DUF1232 domain-containing protein n=1 Tax=Halobacillus sp. BAB-2008 TaxID=1246484 RepID=UPI0002A4E42A|nr:DUF1232 domain-containing protein [Halobacillus sp. BAB-2008]ELK47776.1 hypothetical protein D479_05410 [Halobacillus sp. BAB-2008]
MSSSTKLGEYLKERMGLLALSMREIGRRAGIDPAVVSKIMNGRRRATPAHLEKLAGVLDVPLKDLYRLADYPLDEEEKGSDELAQSVETIHQLLKVSEGYDGDFSLDRLKGELSSYQAYAGTEEGKASIKENFKQKLMKVGSAAGPFIQQLERMYDAFFQKEKSRRELMVIGGVLLYFIAPVDVIPDYFFPIGYVDDALAVQLYLSMVTKS